ncbi:Transcription factor [Taxawa tesnikishii (nom. ined.)]|nr:Transcription factor [Dothideales sp. JES 119]
MAAVAAARSSNNSPALGSKTMHSPKDTKRVQLKTEEHQRKASPFAQDSRQTSPSRADAQQVPTILQPEDSKPPVDAAAKDNAAPATAPATNAPLAPPPRPNQANGQENGDYFSGSHTAHLTKEPNPFESAFGNPSETPGKTQLPGVTSLTSPASLLPGGTPGWGGSLRSGPLSPAMLTGPTATNDYFSSDHHPFAGSFPTPNESSLRTGLTPGGGGSMFPAPSPNSQAIYNAMQSGGATPSTLDFHRTAMHARAASLNNQPNNQNLTMPNGATSAPQDPNIDPNIQSRGFPPHSQQQQQDPFGQHDANDAANSLYILAQSREGRNGPQQYPVPQQPQQMNYMPNAPHMGGVSQQQHDMSPDMAKRAAKNSVGSNISGSTQNEQGEFSESGNSEQAKPQTRPRAKKAGSIKAAGNGRRKAEETPGKAPANKKQKSIGGSVNMQDDELDSDEEDQQDLNDGNNGNKKMTDEEKRKNFLERNRVAALKCRQRKKQWLANLQQKVEIFSTENDALAATVTSLREEIVGLKTLLLAHKDCPVSQAQGISGMAMQNIAGEPQHYANPYGMGMPQGMPQQGMPPQPNMQRR